MKTELSSILICKHPFKLKEFIITRFLNFVRVNNKKLMFEIRQRTKLNNRISLTIVDTIAKSRFIIYILSIKTVKEF